MTLPFEGVDVFIASTDNVLQSVESRGSVRCFVIGNYKNSIRIRLWREAGAVFMKTTVRIWKIHIISLLHNTFSSVIWMRGWKLGGTCWGAVSAGCSGLRLGAQCDNQASKDPAHGPSPTASEQDRPGGSSHIQSAVWIPQVGWDVP